jgi:multidrug efflux pump subunit AcrB
MIRYLLKRPIAVFLFFLILLSFGIISFFQVPVSLLPSIDVPKATVQINFPNASAEKVNQTVTMSLLESLRPISGVQEIKSLSSDHGAEIQLVFDYRTKMDLAFLDINEQLDKLSGSFPKDMERPRVVRSNTSDVPVIRFQIVPRASVDIKEASALVEGVIRRRVEQLKGVSLVDLNGTVDKVVAIRVLQNELLAVGLSEDDLFAVLRSSNTDVGSLSVRDGEFRYFLKLSGRISSIGEILDLPITTKGGGLYRIRDFARAEEIADKEVGTHLYNGKKGIVINIHKQPNARMNDLMPELEKLNLQLQKDFPQLEISTSQNQNFLLEEGISNLNQDLVYGGIFCILLLFLFVGNFASPLLMGLSIPISLCLTFLLFYAFDISFNIISLSGLALGVGMLIDNSIIVLDNIIRHRRMGMDVDQSCITGVKEMVSPIISNVLTTVAIYAPLIFLNGLAGALIYDQAIALTISLGVSVLVAFVLNPLMFKYLIGNNKVVLKEDTAVFKSISKGYHKMIGIIFKSKKKYFLITLFLMVLGISLFPLIPLSTLPQITETETMVKINWNEPVDLEENLIRTKKIIGHINYLASEWEAEVGISRFLFVQGDRSVQKVEIYYRTKSHEIKSRADKILVEAIKTDFPDAEVNLNGAPNAFTQLFQEDGPYFECRFRTKSDANAPQVEANYQKLLQKLKTGKYDLGSGFLKNEIIELHLDLAKMRVYSVSQAQLLDELNRLFGRYVITNMRSFSDNMAVVSQIDDRALEEKFQTRIINGKGDPIPLKYFVTYNMGQDRAHISVDKAGEYRSISFPKSAITDVSGLEEWATEAARQSGLKVDFSGTYFARQELFREMILIFAISLIILYFILAVQFENLLHPLIVMLTIPLGIGGALFMLWATGSNLDVMAAIGFIVVLGIIVDDPSLKIETINRLMAEYSQNREMDRREALTKALHDAGEICLKPLLMVSLTTSLALVPVLFSPGIGNDLQRPMVYVIIGGLSIGTFFTLWFIPLAYWFLTKKK